MSGKPVSLMVWDEFELMGTCMPIKRFKKSTVEVIGHLIRKHGRPITITIPPKINFVAFLRLMYAEHGSGKLYIPRDPATMWGSLRSNESSWEVVMWGGGRQNAKKIRVVSVMKKDLPKTIQLIELVSG